MQNFVVHNEINEINKYIKPDKVCSMNLIYFIHEYVEILY